MEQALSDLLLLVLCYSAIVMTSFGVGYGIGYTDGKAKIIQDGWGKHLPPNGFKTGSELYKQIKEDRK